MGYVSPAFAVLQILAIGKFPDRIHWLGTLYQPVPPGIMVPSFFNVITILLKVIERVFSGRTELSCR
jgi:hypothetical protein